jgi:hypothetical protein
MALTRWRGYQAHVLPGRLRVWLPTLCHNPTLARQVTARLSRLPGVRQVRANPLTGSLLVHYQPGTLTLAALAPHLQLAAPRSPYPIRECGGRPGVKPPTGQVVLSGAALAAVATKRLLVGPSALSTAWGTYDLAGVVTLLASYPFLRRGVQDACRHRRLDGDLLLGLAGLAATLLRENVLGLSVLFLTNLNHWLFARLLQQSATPAVAGPGAALSSGAAAGPGAAPPQPVGPSRNQALHEHAGRQAAQWGLWAAAIALLTGTLTSDWRRALAALIAAAPAASASAVTLPLKIADTVALRHRRLSAQARTGSHRTALVRSARRTRIVFRQARSVARQNQALAASMNIAGLGLAATGAIGPLGASLWHNLTSLAVVGNSMRLHRP